MAKNRKKRSTQRRPSTSLNMTDDDVLGVILKAARTTTTRKRGLAPAARLAAMTMGTLTAAKLLLRLQRAGGDDFQPAVWEQLEQGSDDLASRHFEVITAGYEGVPGIRLKGEREYLHLVRNRTGVRWCRTTIQDDEPSPFTEEVMTADVPPLADAIMWRIVEDLSQIRAALKAHGTGEQQTFHLIGETIALVAAAKLHLALWGNGKLSAAFEKLADRAAAQYQLTDQDPSR
jgi:hypothetical protein